MNESEPLLRMLSPAHYKRRLQAAYDEQRYMGTASATGISEAEAREILAELRATSGGPELTVDWDAARAQLLARSAAQASAGAEPPPADPRVGPLMDLAQGLITGYGDLATTFAARIPDPVLRDRIVADAHKTIDVARVRYCDIAAGKLPRAT